MSKRCTNNSTSSELFTEIKMPEKKSSILKCEESSKNFWDATLDLFEFTKDDTIINDLFESSSPPFDDDPFNFDVKKSNSETTLSSFMTHSVNKPDTNFTVSDCLSSINHTKNFDLTSTKSVEANDLGKMEERVSPFFALENIPITYTLSKKEQKDQIRLNKKLVKENEKQAKRLQKKLNKKPKLPTTNRPKFQKTQLKAFNSMKSESSQHVRVNSYTHFNNYMSSRKNNLPYQPINAFTSNINHDQTHVYNYLQDQQPLQLPVIVNPYIQPLTYCPVKCNASQPEPEVEVEDCEFLDLDLDLDELLNSTDLTSLLEPITENSNIEVCDDPKTDFDGINMVSSLVNLSQLDNLDITTI